MKIKFLSPALAGVLLATLGFGEAANAGLIAHWNFDEESGSQVFDNSGNNYHGNIFNVSRVDGIYGNALAFDSSLDKVVMGNSSSLAMTGDNTYTVSVWVNGITAGGVCCGQLAGFRNQNGWTLRADHRDTKKFEFLQATTSGYFGDGGNDGVNTPDGWHMLTNVINNNLVSMYVDGALVDTYSFSGTTTVGLGGDLIIGAVTDGYLSGGALDDLRIYDNALSAEEVSALYLDDANSAMAVPEPSTLALFFLGMMGLASRRLKK